MFRIKICGITSPADALAAAEAGADAVGLNFYPASPRFVGADVAQAIVVSLPDSVAKVGVFVNASHATLEQAATQLDLDYLQLHGDEPPELVAQLAPRQVIRAIRLGEHAWRPVIDYLAACRKAGRVPAALLIDAHAAGLYGGTGQTADWDLVRARPDELGKIPIILAGGLTPVNVASAIAAAHPWGVDTASGVESAPGVKDAAKVREFIMRAKAIRTLVPRP